jgi:hypothetical protein
MPSGHKQTAQIAVTLFAYIAEPVLAATRMLFRHNTDQGREVRPDRKELELANGSDQSRGQPGPTPEASSSLMLISLDRRRALISRSNSRTCSLILRN